MSEIEFVDLKDNKQCNKDIKKLYKQAFPKEEKAPYYKDIVFVFYLAIDEKLRGQGYGSKILNSIKSKYNNHRIILNIEEIDKSSNNYEQRVKRKEFYRKNGFYDLNYTIKEVGLIYEMMCYNKENKEVSKEEYMELMKNYFGNILFKYVYRKISE